MSRFNSPEFGINHEESSVFYAPHAWLNVISRSGEIGRSVGHRSTSKGWESHVVFDGSSSVETLDKNEVRVL